MVNAILSSVGIGNTLGTADIVVMISVCGIVELFKQKVFNNSQKFKDLCPYITVLLSFAIYLAFGLITKSGSFWSIAGKGIIDGGLAVLCYDSIIAKLKKAMNNKKLEEEVGSKVDEVLGLPHED